MKLAVKFLKRLVIFSIVLQLILASSCSLVLNSSEKAFRHAFANKPFDAIVVPGVPLEKDKWSDVMKLRVFWSHYLWKEGIAKNVIFSGSAVYTPYVEAEIMAAYARKLGIPEENIYLELQAEHSTENIFYGNQLAQKLGFNKVALATDPFQTTMTNSFRKKYFKDMLAIPVQFDVIDSIGMYDPEMEFDQYEVDNFVPITEREGFFKRLKGTMGKNIKDSLNIN